MKERERIILNKIKIYAEQAIQGRYGFGRIF